MNRAIGFAGFKASESADELANDYECDREKIEEAIRCELSLAEAA